MGEGPWPARVLFLRWYAGGSQGANQRGHRLAPGRFEGGGTTYCYTKFLWCRISTYLKPHIITNHFPYRKPKRKYPHVVIFEEFHWILVISVSQVALPKLEITQAFDLIWPLFSSRIRYKNTSNEVLTSTSFGRNFNLHKLSTPEKSPFMVIDREGRMGEIWGVRICSWRSYSMW